MIRIVKILNSDTSVPDLHEGILAEGEDLKPGAFISFDDDGLAHVFDAAANNGRPKFYLCARDTGTNKIYYCYVTPSILFEVTDNTDLYAAEGTRLILRYNTKTQEFNSAQLDYDGLGHMTVVARKGRFVYAVAD